MSEIRVDTFKAEDGISAPSFPNGINVTGVVTASSLQTNVASLNVGSNINLGNAGIITATSYRGDGSQLTGISVGLSTNAQTVTNGNTVLLDLSKDDHKITTTGTTTISCTGGTEGDSHTVRVINSGISTVGFSTYFLFPSGGTPGLPTADGAMSMISFTVNRAGSVGVSTQLFAGASVNFS
tara:strand:+ start:229 stop:774 length:546 start_codon:yes stop_codon:yes gene_type:complete